MSHQTDAGLIIFSSYPEFYELEESGVKHNTVRFMGVGEADRAKSAKRIAVNCTGKKRGFEADLTNVCDAGTVCGKTLVVFSWDVTTVALV